MNTTIDILEVIELMQLTELIEAGMVRDICWLKRFSYLKSKYPPEIIEEIKKSNVKSNLHEQRCTKCGYISYSEDGHTCDICYNPTMRLIK